MAFTDELRISLVAGRALARDGLREVDCEGRLASEALTPRRWEVCEPLFRAALAGRSSAIEIELEVGHDSPLLATSSAVTALDREPGPALGLPGPNHWPLHRVSLPADAAIMLFTDGLTERRASERAARVGFDELLSRLDAPMFLTQPPEQAIDGMLARVFPDGTEHLDDDLAVILLTLGATATARRAAGARISPR